MIALWFIVICAVLIFLIDAFGKSVWWGLFTIFSSLAYISVIAGFFTGFGFIILWPLAFLLWTIAKSCDDCWTRQKATQSAPVVSKSKVESKNYTDLDRCYQRLVVATTLEQKHYWANEITRLKKEIK